MKKYEPEQIVTLLWQIAVEIANERTLLRPTRMLKPDQTKRWKQLVKESSKLKRC
jgi:hypothetical protein